MLADLLTIQPGFDPCNMIVFGRWHFGALTDDVPLVRCYSISWEDGKSRPPNRAVGEAATMISICAFSRGSEESGIVGFLAAANEYLPGILVYLVVPLLVWATVVAGLILIVRDKIEEDDVIEYLAKHDTNGWDTQPPGNNKLCPFSGQQGPMPGRSPRSTTSSIGRIPEPNTNERS